MDRLYMEHVGPAGSGWPGRGARRRTTTRRRPRSGRGTRSRRRPRCPRRSARARGSARVTVPYYDLTVSAAKSISVLHASLKIAAQEAYNRGDLVAAGKLNAEADGIEADLEACGAVRAGTRRGRGVLYPDRAPLGYHGGVAGRGGPGRGDVHPSHQPGRGPAAARPHRDREPGAAGRRGGRQVPAAGHQGPAQPAAVDRGAGGPGDGGPADRPGVRHGAAGRTGTAARSAGCPSRSWACSRRGRRRWAPRSPRWRRRTAASTGTSRPSGRCG